MEILFFSSYFHPEKTGVGAAATDCARLLRQLGHTVRVMTAMPFFPEWRIHEGYRGRLLMTESTGGIEIHRVWLHVPTVPTTLARILHELSFSILAFLRGLFLPGELFLCNSPFFTTAFMAAILSAIRRKPFWLMIHDVQPDIAIELGMLTNPLAIALSRWMERWIYRRAERILVLSGGLLEKILSKGVPEEKLVIVPLSVDVDAMANAAPPPPAGYFAAQGIEAEFVVVHSGAFLVKHDFSLLVETALEFSGDPGIFLAIVGEGHLAEEIQARIDALGLENIRLMPLCEAEELPGMLASAGALVVIQKPEIIDLMVSSKLLLYLSTGKPLLAAVHQASEAGRLLAENDLAVILPPSDPRALAGAIREIRRDPGAAFARAARSPEFMRANFDHAVVRDRFYRPLFG